jgi:predicted dehydrogenase
MNFPRKTKTGRVTEMSTGIAVIGCGWVSEVYLTNLTSSSSLRVVGCADLDPDRAAAKAARHGIPARTVEDLLGDPEVSIVVNLTVPQAHQRVNLAAVAAGKSVYSEKPLAVTRDEAATLRQRAVAAGVRVGCAPDTFLGGGLQTCRRLLDEGAIGTPVAATAFMAAEPAESWHPDPPAFLYQPGAGPLFDMAVYHVTGLVALLGPVHSVTALAGTPFAVRTIVNGPKRGRTVPVAVPTHVSATLQMAGGVLATLVATFDTRAHSLPHIEIYGSQGTLCGPDPNTFGGPVRLARDRSSGWAEMALAPGPVHDARGLGVADLAEAQRAGRPHRADGELAYHVLDVLESILDSARTGAHVVVGSTCERPEPLAAAVPAG